MSNAPDEGINEADLKVGEPKTKAAGVPGVLHAMEIALKQMGPIRTAETLLRLNQKDGFDCPGCAWPEADKRHLAEFCENGAKAVAEEATRRRVSPEFFAEHSIADLLERDDYWLGQQGRLTHPMLLDDVGAADPERHYRPIEWAEAFALIKSELQAMDSPEQAIFYTSGRTSNEAAFLYQLLVRGLGSNNLPDCSNMCHESSGSALGQTIGIGKGSVSLEDIHEAKLLLIAGQNPGTNHPRMLSALEKAKRNGARIIAINPLPEAGLLRFKNPQNISGVLGDGTEIADEFLQIRIGGDQALFQFLGKLLLEAEAAGREVLDHGFIKQHTTGFADYSAAVADLDLATVLAATGLTEEQIRSLAADLIASDRTIVCWAMGLTQHKHSVATLRDVVNLLLLQGNIGKTGAGVCPVRGHSNVQGDRTMGIFEKMPESFHDALDAEFDFASPRKHGFDTVAAIHAMEQGKARVFMGMGGNFVRAAPDTDRTEAALRRTALTVQVSTKLNRSHLVTGSRALILPTLGRTERDRQSGGDQKVTVEDSMSAVHASHGRLAPASEQLLSEVAIIARLAQTMFQDDDGARLPNTPVADWAALSGDYTRIRKHIAAVVPGFSDYEAKIERPGGFVLPHGPRDGRRFATPSGKAVFTGNELEFPEIPAGRLLLQTLRSHDQYNTTIYGKDDRYRGIYGGRRVLFINEVDLDTLGFAEGDAVDLVSEWTDPKTRVCTERRAEEFRLVAYPTPVGCAAAYYPETNVLVPLESTADVSGTPTSKSVIIRLAARTPVAVG
ncbi:FdhF/YdeP family oxidoreductase [Arthrobacter russicus]|uniref:Molybdopterin-dependent oxidoreductase alpha subunit n=1 Tax=Arthrobacter russicus TaxID=172040 RepID=A0ABU1J9Z9_9MICC|nr:FdhF/YdeP family oxidoreductase [Arthrobacter russicus]MDR6269247.1 molybdopterin-dependent oxidoreductase alpha subunit [Arthrobacter russicus]